MNFRNIKCKNRLETALISFFTGFFLISVVRADSGSTTIDDLLNWLYSIVRVAGGLITIYEFGMVIFCIKNENSEAMSQHIMKMVVGMALMAIKTIMSS